MHKLIICVVSLGAVLAKQYELAGWLLAVLVVLLAVAWWEALSEDHVLREIAELLTAGSKGWPT